jgi:hypothetical protein
MFSPWRSPRPTMWPTCARTGQRAASAHTALEMYSVARTRRPRFRLFLWAGLHACWAETLWNACMHACMDTPGVVLQHACMHVHAPKWCSRRAGEGNAPHHGPDGSGAREGEARRVPGGRLGPARALPGVQARREHGQHAVQQLRAARALQCQWLAMRIVQGLAPGTDSCRHTGTARGPAAPRGACPAAAVAARSESCGPCLLSPSMHSRARLLSCPPFSHAMVDYGDYILIIFRHRSSEG